MDKSTPMKLATNYSVLFPSYKELQEVFQPKHGLSGSIGWGPSLRFRFRYFSPDDIYEALVAKLVTKSTVWLDVGCGRDLFPSNRPLARRLAGMCQMLVGLDLSENIFENDYIHRRVRGSIEDFESDTYFDLVTLRMVAEHLTDPVRVMQALSRVVVTGGRVVVYTVNKGSPVSVVSKVVPFKWHHSVKNWFWDADEKDTFPVAYRLNTRKALKRNFESGGFREECFAYLDDCRTFSRSRFLNAVELAVWKALRSVGLHYPETCLLGVYRKTDRL